MRTTTIAVALLQALLYCSSTASASFLHAPHDQAHNISCINCHEYSFTDPWPAYIPDPGNDDVTVNNFICLKCHDGTADGPLEIAAPLQALHTSLVLIGSSGWSTQCVDCHDPHFQGQLEYYLTAHTSLYLVTGTIDQIDTVTQPGHSIITYSGTTTNDNWPPAVWGEKTGQNRGLIMVIDDDTDPTNIYPSATFEIAAATGSEIFIATGVGGNFVGRQFGIIYGQLIRSGVMTTDGKERAVRFYDPNGVIDGGGDMLPGGLVDESGNMPPQGLCQVCHTNTANWKADGTGSSHNNGRNCSECHKSVAGFGFVHDSPTGAGCESCHGHDAGFEYAPGMFSTGAGTTKSHSTHTELDSDDQIGPNISCASCHDTENYPYFISGTDSDSDGRYTLAETNVCDGCHSEGGPFAGVTDADSGAKNNWSNGVYDANGQLLAGKEKWCAGCHDSGSSIIAGVPAPNVAGDPSQTWGYYVSGHGVNSCLACHDGKLRHIDGEPRTYAYSGPVSETFASQPYSLYQEGYRLVMVDGDYPLHIPKVPDVEAIDETTDFRLCLQCHESSNLFNDTPPFTTNFSNSGPYQTYGKAYYETNSHRSHLYHEFPDFPEGPYPGDDMWWDSDWNVLTGNPNRGGADSAHSCVTCHNVHGSSYPAMVRDGRLSGRTRANGFDFDGLPFEYLAVDGVMPAVTSGQVDLSNSIGAVMRASSVLEDDSRSFDNTCWMGCHQKKVAPAPAYTTMEEYAYCGLCHAETFYKNNYIGNYGIDYFREPSTGP